MRISDWSSDVCSSDLDGARDLPRAVRAVPPALRDRRRQPRPWPPADQPRRLPRPAMEGIAPVAALPGFRLTVCRPQRKRRAPMTFAIRNLDHVVVCVSDLERALKFYTEVLGCREERRVERIGLVQLRAGASMIDLQRVNPGQEESDRKSKRLTPSNKSE